jgi:hypothetical protein
MENKDTSEVYIIQEYGGSWGFLTFPEGWDSWAYWGKKWSFDLVGFYRAVSENIVNTETIKLLDIMDPEARGIVGTLPSWFLDFILEENQENQNPKMEKIEKLIHMAPIFTALDTSMQDILTQRTIPIVFPFNKVKFEESETLKIVFSQILVPLLELNVVEADKPVIIKYISRNISRWVEDQISTLLNVVMGFEDEDANEELVQKSNEYRLRF